MLFEEVPPEGEAGEEPEGEAEGDIPVDEGAGGGEETDLGADFDEGDF